MRTPQLKFDETGAALLEREGGALQVRVSADGLRVPLLESSRIVLDNLGGARVAITKRSNAVRVEAFVPESADLVRWNFHLDDDQVEDGIPIESRSGSVEELIYDYRVALAGRL